MAMLNCERCGGQILVRSGMDNPCLQCGRHPEPAKLVDVWSRWSFVAAEKLEAVMNDGPTARQAAMGVAEEMILKGKSHTQILNSTGLSVSDLGRSRRSVVRRMDQSPLF